MQASTGAGGTRRETQQTWKPFIVLGETGQSPRRRGGRIPALRERALPVSQPRGVWAEGPPLPSHQTAGRRPGEPPGRGATWRAGDNLALEREGERRAGVGRHRSACRSRVAAPAPPPGPPRAGSAAPTAPPAQAPPQVGCRAKPWRRAPSWRRRSLPRWLGSAGSRPPGFV